MSRYQFINGCQGLPDLRTVCSHRLLQQNGTQQHSKAPCLIPLTGFPLTRPSRWFSRCLHVLIYPPAQAPCLDVLESTGCFLSIISGETEAQGESGLAEAREQLPTPAPAALLSRAPCSPSQLFSSSVFGCHHLTFSFVLRITSRPTASSSSGLSLPERCSFSFLVERNGHVLWYYYLNVYSLPFSAHHVPSRAESDGPTQVSSAPSGPCLAAGGPLYGAAAEGPYGLRCSPRRSIL